LSYQQQLLNYPYPTVVKTSSKNS